jgi:tyrosyl-tRNA synthetase
LKLFTEISIEKISEYEKLEGSELNKIKKILADETTTLLHGKDCLENIHNTVDSLFSSLSSSSNSNLDSLAKFQLKNEDFATDNKISIVDLLVKSEMVASKNEGKRLIKNGGVRINDEKVEDENEIIWKSKFDEKGKLKLSTGKKKHILVLLP